MPEVQGAQLNEVAFPGRVLVASIGPYRSELFAYLMFDHYRGVADLRSRSVTLVSSIAEPRSYRVVVRAPDNLLEALPWLHSLKAKGVVADFDWETVAPTAFEGFRRQTTFFDDAYNLPVQHALGSIPRSRMTAPMRQFLRFKSATDPRVRRKLQPVPEPLSVEAAGRLAGDIIAVADFYHLPLDFFIGIGAMENNYMNVTGDLEHAVWKRRAEKGDIVLKRRNGRVLVRNFSSGVWQITRETLRYVHSLYLKDQRDYTVLPEYLRPPRELDLDNIDPEVLTTYAGLLFRDLLDHFNGDVTKAVGAYNGGTSNPNMAYSEGVARAAGYARRMLSQAARLSGPAVEMSFIGR